MSWNISQKNIYNKEQIRSFNILSLAYIGDCIYEIYFRNYIFKKFGHIDSKKLHIQVIKYVNAKFQSHVYFSLKEKFNQDELDYFKRGRNSRIKTSPKNCSISEYRIATGVESLIGYLYINGNFERLDFIFDEIFKLI